MCGRSLREGGGGCAPGEPQETRGHFEVGEALVRVGGYGCCKLLAFSKFSNSWEPTSSRCGGVAVPPPRRGSPVGQLALWGAGMSTASRSPFSLGEALGGVV